MEVRLSVFASLATSGCGLMKRGRFVWEIIGWRCEKIKLSIDHCFSDVTLWLREEGLCI